MTLTIKKLTLIAFLGALVACGGGDDTAATEEATEQAEEIAEDIDIEGVEAEDIIVDTASDVVTTLGDVNGFKIVTTTFNPHSDDIYGTEVDITAYVKDHSNNPVEDGTVVTFVADDNGLIEDQCITVNGQCSVIWWSAGDRSQPMDPDASGDAGYQDNIITIMARTVGEDSFIDKNSNSLFDVGEVRFTQSEPFIDTNDDGDYDAGINDFDEYFDYNKNGEFDGNEEFTLYRGESCSTSAIAVGHCAEKLEIWDTVRMINSSGDEVDFEVTNCVTAAVLMDTRTSTSNTISLSGTTDLCLELFDRNGNIPPIGTQITITNTNGLIASLPTEVTNRYVTPGTGFEAKFSAEPDGTSSTGSIKVETESVDGQKLSYFFTVTD
jgi:hypothetical protein